MSHNMKTRYIPLGKVLITPGIEQLCESSYVDIGRSLARHARGDWGEVCPEDKAVNDDAVVNGERLLSAYTLSDGTKIWIITERDRSVTTILLPDEY